MSSQDKKRFALLPMIDDIQESVKNASLDDPAAHTALLDKINALQLAAESPMETIDRIGNTVCPALILRARPSYKG